MIASLVLNDVGTGLEQHYCEAGSILSSACWHTLMLGKGSMSVEGPGRRRRQGMVQDWLPKLCSQS